MSGHEKMERLLGILNRYASEIDPPFPHWMAGEQAAVGCFCKSCAEKELAAGHGEFIDGGYGYIEEDGCLHCEGCGALLDYTLTDSGVYNELSHFEKRRFRTAPSFEEAFHIARMVECGAHEPRTIRVAERAVAALSRSRP